MPFELAGGTTIVFGSPFLSGFPDEPSPQATPHAIPVATAMRVRTREIFRIVMGPSLPACCGVDLIGQVGRDSCVIRGAAMTVARGELWVDRRRGRDVVHAHHLRLFVLS
jgi:hypothetical protein